MACHCADPKPICEMKEMVPRNRNFPEGPDPPYLPNDEDRKLNKFQGPAKEKDERLWATGRPTWTTESGMQGERPVVDRYSTTRASSLIWRRQNQEVLDEIEDYSFLKHNVECLITRTAASADKEQNENTVRLLERTKSIDQYKNQLEGIIIDLRTTLVDVMRKRSQVKKLAAKLVDVPENIAGECIDVRTTRYPPDLIKDQLEVELIKEKAMTYEIRGLLDGVYQDLTQLECDLKGVKQVVELDWSDKKESSAIDHRNASLRNDSTGILFHLGVTRPQGDQSTPEHWNHFSKEMTMMSGSMIKKAQDFIKNIDDEIVPKALQDLRNQADNVMTALHTRVTETDQARQCFERELDYVLRQIVENETLEAKLRKMLHQLDSALRVAQTRLDARMGRLRVENCSDVPQAGLLDEINHINEKMKEVKAEIINVQNVLLKMYKNRATLESNIFVKRKTLFLDKERIIMYRAFYPDLVIDDD